jgi:hypothetical protein
MSTKVKWNAGIAIAVLSLTSVVGCVADRPARNGVFNENQYIRKDFLVRAGDSTSPDSGWMLKATVVEASEPNVFGGEIFGLFSGSHSMGDLMHFVITSDKLQMVSNRAINSDPLIAQEPTTEPEVINAWPATNVDLKYRVNLDGETTNFYEENQELDWQVRQWVKVNFDKNDMSDLAPLGSFYTMNLAHCVDMGNVSVTLVPDSFLVDEAHDYMEWTVQVTLPILWTTNSSPATSTTNTVDGSDCVEAYGPMAIPASNLGRQNETVSLKYSMTRAIATPTYEPLVVQEKDPIQKKYGPILYNSIARDSSSGLLGSNAYVVRFDPTQPIDWYFEQGFPTKYMPYFTKNNLPSGVSALTGVTTIEDATNALLQGANAKARVAFHQYNEPMTDGTPINRAFGDVRWNMLRWLESEDQQAYFAGVTSEVIDPRTGQALTSDIVFENFAIKDLYVARIDAYLQSVGMSPAGSSPFDQTAWPPTVLDANGKTVNCTSANIGATVPIIPATVVANHNGTSTLFQKMQGYLQEPVTNYGPLGPQNFIAQHLLSNGQPDTDFFTAYYAYLPYIVYGDPTLNPFVIPESGATNSGPGASSQVWSALASESQLHSLESQLDQGWAPYDVGSATGETDAQTFLANYKALTMNHRSLQYTRPSLPMLPGAQMPITHADVPDAFAMVSVVQRDGRACVNVDETTGKTASPHWETKQEWIDALTNTYWSQVFWHEFGHTLGLEHNFMASVDKPNFPPSTATNSDGTPRYPLYSSSVMEYNAPVDRIMWTEGWGPYDKGAISWIYANANGVNKQGKPPSNTVAAGISGQLSPTYPWFDPQGFNSAGTENMYLYCNERHARYTPLCRAGDLGTTPSEIMANDIDQYEWMFQFRNFRTYHKFWDDSNYGDEPMNFVTESRRFLPLWALDFNTSSLIQTFPKININPPAGAASLQTYYGQLTQAFDDEMDHANSMMAAFHEAIVQQSAGARPYITTFDNYFGDVTQQGIMLDKLDAIQAFAAMWPVDNYNQNVAAGAYIASYGEFGSPNQVDNTSHGSMYQTTAEDALMSMLGGGFDAFAYALPLAVAEFQIDSHSPEYLEADLAPIRQEAGQWAGGYQFNRIQDFLAFFQNIACENNFVVTTEGGTSINCTKADPAACTYDPRTPQGYPQDTFYSNTLNEFLGPDGRRWTWAYFQDRNQWVACDQDRNVDTFTTMLNWNTLVTQQGDDGSLSLAGVKNSTAYQLEMQLNYTLDYYAQALIFQGTEQQP